MDIDEFKKIVSKLSEEGIERTNQTLRVDKQLYRQFWYVCDQEGLSTARVSEELWRDFVEKWKILTGKEVPTEEKE